MLDDNQSKMSTKEEMHFELAKGLNRRLPCYYMIIGPLNSKKHRFAFLMPWHSPSIDTILSSKVELLLYSKKESPHAEDIEDDSPKEIEADRIDFAQSVWKIMMGTRHNFTYEDIQQAWRECVR